MEPDPRYTYDSYTEVAVYPKSRVGSGDHTDHGRHCGIDGNSVYTVRHYAGICRVAGCVFSVFDSVHTAVYAVGNEFKESIYPSLRRAVVKEALNYELDKHLDKSVRHNGTFWIEYGLLGVDGIRCAGGCFDECCFLGNKAQALTGCKTAYCSFCSMPFTYLIWQPIIKFGMLPSYAYKPIIGYIGSCSHSY